MGGMSTSHHRAPDAAEPTPSPAWVQRVARDVGALERSSTAERVADVLRRRITEGDLAPRAHLPEEQLIAALRVSRNTLREAFRMLSHEGLLVHELHRGVFVREVDEADLRDLYRLRLMIECGVIRSLAQGAPGDLGALHTDLSLAVSASSRGDWVAVGTANMAFHHDLVALAKSPRTDQTMQRLLAEVRLAFHAAASPERLHGKYVDRNRELLDLLVAGEYEPAAHLLEDYLRDSLAELLDALTEQA